MTMAPRSAAERDFYGELRGWFAKHLSATEHSPFTQTNTAPIKKPSHLSHHHYQLAGEVTLLLSVSHERTLDVIRGFSDAAMDESLWPASLQSLCDLTRSHGASFWVLDGSGTPQLPTFICINFDMKSIKEYLEHAASIDPTVHYLVAHPDQPIVHDGLVITEQEKDKHPYYDWHERNIQTRFRMVGQTRLTPTVQAGVALHRKSKEGRYEPKDINRFAVLHGHLERALAIAFRIGSLGALKQVTSEWLDRSSAAVLFLDKQKHIVFANRAAELLRSSGEGITLGIDGMTLLDRRDNKKLQSLIDQVLCPVASTGGSAGGTMRAVRPSGRRPYGIFVSPVSKANPFLAIVRPVVCIVITDPDCQEPIPGKHLQDAFDFTRGEAKLASLLASGEDLRSAADKLEITYGTARMRLVEIFQKTQTHRQGELIHLLVSTVKPDLDP